MKNKRIITIFLSFLLFITSQASCSFVWTENTAATIGDARAKREVYLHAKNHNPVGTSQSSTVIKNDPFNLYFAIDNPNKGFYNETENDPEVSQYVAEAILQKRSTELPKAEEKADKAGITDATERAKFIEEYLAPILSLEAKRAEQMIRHEQKQYDLNGYAVRIYYDKTFFKLSEGVNADAPIDYTVPDKTIPNTETDEEEKDPDNNSDGNISYATGYSAYHESGGFDNEKGLNYAETTVFFYGSFLPQEKNDSEGNKWYDLCALPLIPLKTGSTKVSIEISGDSSKNSLILFSKHESDAEKEFEFSAINGGEHTINIVNSVRPVAPEAMPRPADFVKGDKVKLVCKDANCNAEDEKHDIYYSIDGKMPYEKYEGQEITIEKTTVISCYSVKKSDISQDSKSEIVSFKYEMLPEKPVLFVDPSGKPITNVYTASDPFSVFCDTFVSYDGSIEDDINIYYTFSDIYVEDFTDSDGKFKTDGSDPETEWVKVEKSLGLKFDINKTVKVKLVTVRENQSVGQEISEVSTYILNIRPNVVKAVPAPCENPGQVELSAEDGCEIYYTTDGSDPSVNGTKYNSAIDVSKDTLIRAVAKKDGVFSKTTDFSYTVTNHAGSVISANYPSGEYEGKIWVSLSSDNPDDKILYTTDGGVTWIPYDGKISVDKTTVIEAKVEGLDEVFKFSYDIKPLAPVFAPGSTLFAQPDSVTIYCQETVNDGFDGINSDDYTLYYTTDGSDPRTNTNAENTKNSPVNTAKVSVSERVTIKAAVKTKDGMWSDVVSGTYDVLSYKLASPVPTIKPGKYTADKIFTGFFEEQQDCEIYYTVSEGDTFEKDPVANDETPNKHYVRGSGNSIELSGRVIIKAIAVNKALNLKSDVAVFEYIVMPEEQPSASCYADKQSGIYEIPSSNEKFLVNIYSDDSSSEIKYKIDNGEWQEYDSQDAVEIENDCTLYVMVNGEVVQTYTYEFVPKAPVATLLSGKYDLKEPPYQVKITLPEGYSSDDYYLYYRDNEAEVDSLETTGSTIGFNIVSSVSYKAYVVDIKTNKRSENAVFYYVVESDEAVAGDIYTVDPYKVKSGDTKYISKHLLSQKGFNEGIKLDTKTNGAKIKYKYTYIKEDGKEGGAEYQFYTKNNPIMVTSSMKELTVNAYLTDADGVEIVGSDAVFKYKFVDILIPQFVSGSKTIENDYPNDDNYIIYYTLDGNDPDDDKNTSRIRYDGGKINLTESTQIKTVYYKACGENNCPCASGDATLCENYVYGEVGTFNYEAPKKDSSSSGGSLVITENGNKRKYTKDIFGNEHMTHISYIKGYPDGRVNPEGNITREEVTAMLYRMRDKKYDKPFASTGSVFSDVAPDRWSVTEVEFMASENIVLGYPDGEFKPSNNLTRAEFAALIYRFCKLSEADVKNKFTDLSNDHWAYQEIMALHAGGLVEGYEDNTFMPEKYIKRAEVITVINKILGRKPMPSYVKSLDFNPFSDLETDKWYYTDVLEATITHDYHLNSNDFEYKWENWK